MADTIYYVYMNWTLADGTQAADQGRNLMAFKSRQDADEFFRCYDLPRDLILWKSTQWAPVCMPTLLGDWNGRAWTTIPVQAASDWLSGGAFYIRNKLVTSEYWYTAGSKDSKILISTTGRTKFVIKRTSLKKGEVLIRSDTVTIELASAESSSELYVSQTDASGSRLVLSHTSKEWTFKDLFESFGVEYSANAAGTNPEVAHTTGSSVVWDMV